MHNEMLERLSAQENLIEEKVYTVLDRLSRQKLFAVKEDLEKKNENINR